MTNAILKRNRYLNKIFVKIQDFYRIAREDKNFLMMTYLARFVFIREWVGRRRNLNLSNYSIDQSGHVLLANDLKTCMDIMSSDGYYAGLTLAPKTVQLFLDFAFTNPCHGNRSKEDHLLISNQEIASKDFKDSPYQVASYSSSIEDFEGILELKNDPVILELARQYIGREPVYYRSELLWTFPENPLSETIYTQFFHCDINDYRNLKFFFYLTDVDSDCGPHSYIKGSNKRRSLLHQTQGGLIRPAQEAEFIRFYGADQIVNICGLVGSGFMGDPYCLHRGGSPKKNARLLLQIEFGSRLYKSCYSHLK